MCSSSNNADSIVLICIFLEKSFTNARGGSDDNDIHIVLFVYKSNSIFVSLSTIESKRNVIRANSQNILRIYSPKVISLRMLLIVVGVTFR